MAAAEPRDFWSQYPGWREGIRPKPFTNIVDIELSSSILGFRTVAFIDVNMVLCSVVMLGLDMFQSKHVTGPQ